MTQPIRPPLSGGNLEAVCSIDEDILRNIHDLGEDDEEYVTDMVFRPGYDGTVQLCRLSDAQSAIAALEAELAHKNDTINLLVNEGLKTSSLLLKKVKELEAEVNKAMKGTEA